MKHKILTFFILYTLLPVSEVFSQGSGTEPPRLATTTLINPLKINSLEGLLIAILNIVMVLMIPVIVFFIIYAGFLYVTARGNVTQVQDATRALTYAIIGGVLVLASVGISVIIKSTVDEFMVEPSTYLMITEPYA